MKPEELNTYEDMANDYRYEGSIFKPIVLKLVKEVRRLDAWDKHMMYQCDESVKELTAYISRIEAERDWLAMSNADRCVKRSDAHWSCRDDKDCSDCWIDAAKEAVKRD